MTGQFTRNFKEIGLDYQGIDSSAVERLKV